MLSTAVAILVVSFCAVQILAINDFRIDESRCFAALNNQYGALLRITATLGIEYLHLVKLLTNLAFTNSKILLITVNLHPLVDIVIL